MPVRKAQATWSGSLKEGNGKVKAGSGAFEIDFTHGTRFGDTPGTNPEELVGGAIAGCFSMFLSAQLTNAGYPPTRIQTTASVHLGNDDIGPAVTKIELVTDAEVPEVDEETFMELADKSKQNCPISKSLRAVEEITLSATLVS